MATFNDWINFLRAYNTPNEEIEVILITYMSETLGEAQLDCCAFFKWIYDTDKEKFHATINSNGYNAFLNSNMDFTAACIRPNPPLV